MNLRKNIFILIVAVVIYASSCSSGPEHAGREYMPDMAHSIAYEANVLNEYYLNTWEEASVNNGSGKTLLELSVPREPINGTIPRGYAGGNASHDSHGVVVPMNGSKPYYYGDSDEERLRASEEIINNPFPITEAALANGKELYDIFCGTCHGDKGDGNGYLVRDDGGVYPAQPANLIDVEGIFIEATNGQLYHAIMHGKNVMGGYADKISYEERWNVIHYIRSLQAKANGTRYDHKVNTLNSAATPGGDKPAMAHAEEAHEEEGHGHDNDGDHGDGEEHHENDGDHGHDEGSHEGDHDH